jgi:hypothetical protein
MRRSDGVFGLVMLFALGCEPGGSVDPFMDDAATDDAPGLDVVVIDDAVAREDMAIPLPRDVPVSPDVPVAPDVGGPSRTLRVYVSGESIERRNRYVAAPFNADGTLNPRGGGTLRNDTDEYGWMVPMAERLRLRAPDLALEFVGALPWTDAEDADYTGTFPRDPGETSAISGTDIASWLDQRAGELTARSYCYQVAFVSRGGNDFGNDNDADYQRQLVDLIGRVIRGSSCQSNPAVYVTGHMPDDGRGGGSPSDAVLVAQQVQRFVTRVERAVATARASNPAARVYFVDQYTPFLENRATTAFPRELWSTGRVPDYAKIGRVGDRLHPRRLASIYAGELAADAMNLAELRALAR